MFLRRARAGSTATHTWPHDGSVVEVPDHLGAQYLAIPDAGFSAVSPEQAADPAKLAAMLRHGADPGTVELIRTELEAAVTEFRDELISHVRHELGKFRDEVREHLARHTSLTSEGTAAPDTVSPAGDSAASSTEPPAGTTTPAKAPTAKK